MGKNTEERVFANLLEDIRQNPKDEKLKARLEIIVRDELLIRIRMVRKKFENAICGEETDETLGDIWSKIEEQIPKKKFTSISNFYGFFYTCMANSFKDKARKRKVREGNRRIGTKEEISKDHGKKTVAGVVTQVDKFQKLASILEAAENPEVLSKDERLLWFAFEFSDTDTEIELLRELGIDKKEAIKIAHKSTIKITEYINELHSSGSNE